MSIKTSDFIVYYFRPFDSNINNVSGSDRFFTKCNYYEITGININTVVKHHDKILVCYAVIRTNSNRVEDLSNSKQFINVKDLEILGCMRWKKNKQ